jgi:plastocyanin
LVREAIIRNFTHETFTIAVGTKVTWTNQDSAQHTVTAGTPGQVAGTFDSDVLDSGKKVSVTFTQAGTFPYWCRIHPQMTGVVTVR